MVCLSLFLRETGIGINLWTGRWIVILSPAIRSDPVVSFTVDNAMLVNLQHLIATAGYRGTTVAMAISSERVKMELEALGTNILTIDKTSLEWRLSSSSSRSLVDVRILFANWVD
jgi:hypothetical protein